MVKYIYQAVALVFIFAGALFLFGRNMETVKPRKLPARKVTTSLAIIMYLSISIIKQR